MQPTLRLQNQLPMLRNQANQVINMNHRHYNQQQHPLVAQRHHQQQQQLQNQHLHQRQHNQRNRSNYNYNHHHHQKKQQQADDAQLSQFMEIIEERNRFAILYLEGNGFKVNTQNGQRISVPRTLITLKMDGEPYSEIFIGKLPRDLFEDELLPYLLEVGATIIKIRYMLDFSGATRGYCFVKFATTQEACRACKMLDGRQLRPNYPPIGARISFDNKCLYFGNLPPKCSANQLKMALKNADIEGIEKVKMADSVNSQVAGDQDDLSSSALGLDGPGLRSKHAPARFGHVYFVTHEAATLARRQLLPGDVKIMGRRISLDWARSEIPIEIARSGSQSVINAGLTRCGVYCSG